MKYVQPFGVSDPNASYVNGDPSQARKGSIPPAAVFENPQREVVAVISKSQFVPDDADLLQLTKSVRSQFINFAEDTGSQNTLSCAFDPPIGAYSVGLPIRVRVHLSNSGACTIDAGAGRVNIRRPSGAALALGDLTAGGLVDLVYDGTSFQMINFLGTGGTGTVNNFTTKIPYAVDTSSTANIVTVSFTPAITTLAAGDPILVKIANSNVGPTTINVNALAPVILKATAGGDLLPHDLIAGSVVLMIYDGVNFQITPNNTIVSDVTVNIPSTQFNTPAIFLEAIKRKFIGPSATVTMQLGIGIFVPFAVTHPSSNRIAIKGTMLAAAPTLGNFSMTGSTAAQRSADANFNINMLRSRYGTDIRVPTTGGIGIQVIGGTKPRISDLLISCGNTTALTYGVFDESASCVNVAVWGCRGGIGANGNGVIVCANCWVSACYQGFFAAHGGNIQIGGAANGVVGCDNAGLIAQAGAYILAANMASRCHGGYGFCAIDQSLIEGSTVDSLYNATTDIIATNMSEIRFQGYAASTSSPAANTTGNNGSIFLTV